MPRRLDTVRNDLDDLRKVPQLPHFFAAAPTNRPAPSALIHNLATNHGQVSRLETALAPELATHVSAVATSTDVQPARHILSAGLFIAPAMQEPYRRASFKFLAGFNWSFPYV